MNQTEAWDIIENSQQEQNMNDEDEFMLIEAYHFVIADRLSEPVDRMVCACNLAALYYDQRRFDLARRYYEMAYQLGDTSSALSLGYIWYYGRTGKTDYHKAARYFKEAQFLPEAQYKLADCYRYGRGVPKDPQKYREIIEALYRKTEDMEYVSDPVPEIYLRMAEIKEDGGESEEAVELLLSAKQILAQRMEEDRFFGNFVRMQEIVSRLNRLIEFDSDHLELYELYAVLSQPAELQIIFRGKRYPLHAAEEDGYCAVQFMGKWYRSVDEWIKKAKLNGKYLTEIYTELMICEVI